VGRKRGPKPFGRDIGLGRKAKALFGNKQKAGTEALFEIKEKSDKRKNEEVARRIVSGLQSLFKQNQLKDIVVNVNISNIPSASDQYIKSLVKSIVKEMGKEFGDKIGGVEILSPKIKARSNKQGKVASPKILSSLKPVKDAKDVLRLYLPIDKKIMQKEAVSLLSSEISKMIKGEVVNQAILTQPLLRGRGRPSNGVKNEYWAYNLKRQLPVKNISKTSTLPF